jgi:hypothetical protein
MVLLKVVEWAKLVGTAVRVWPERELGTVPRLVVLLSRKWKKICRLILVND